MNSLEEEAAIGRFWYRSMLNAIKWGSDPEVIYLLNMNWLECNTKIRDGEYAERE